MPLLNQSISFRSSSLNCSNCARFDFINHCIVLFTCRVRLLLTFSIGPLLHSWWLPSKTNVGFIPNAFNAPYLAENILMSVGCGYRGLEVRAYCISHIPSTTCTHADVSTATRLSANDAINLRSSS